MIRELLEEMIQEEIPELPDGEYERVFGNDAPDPADGPITYAKLLVHRLLVKACAGNDKSIQEVLDRMLGKPMQITENTNTNQNITYLTFLENCVEQEKMDGIIDAEATPILPPPDVDIFS